MSKTKLLRSTLTILACGLFTVLAAQSAQAATYTWNGGAGAFWSSSSTNWTSGGGPLYWDLSDGTANIADFNTAGATPIVSGTVNANGIQFDSTATISGGTINLVTATGSQFTTPTITVNAASTIASVLSGTAGLTQTGAGTLTLTGVNTYSGLTTLNQGNLGLSSTGGAAIPGNISINNSNHPILYTTQNNQFGPGAVVTFNNGGSNARVELLGTTQTLAGINESNSAGVIQNYEQAPISNYGSSTLVLNGTGSYSFNGYLRNGSGGILGLAMNGSGTQALVGSSINYTGPTTINSGMLRLTSTPNFSSPTTVNSGGTLALNGANTGISANGTFNLNGGVLLSDENSGWVVTSGGVTLSAASTIRTAGTGSSSNTSLLFLDGGFYSAGAQTLTLNCTTVNNGIVMRSTVGNFSGAVIVNGQGQRRAAAAPSKWAARPPPPSPTPT